MVKANNSRLQTPDPMLKDRPKQTSNPDPKQTTMPDSELQNTKLRSKCKTRSQTQMLNAKLRTPDSNADKKTRRQNQMLNTRRQKCKCKCGARKSQPQILLPSATFEDERKRKEKENRGEEEGYLYPWGQWVEGAVSLKDVNKRGLDGGGTQEREGRKVGERIGMAIGDQVRGIGDGTEAAADREGAPALSA